MTTPLTLARRSLLACAAALALATAVQAQDDGHPTLTVALGVIDANFNTTTSSVFRLAQDLGYFERAGVHVEFVALDGTPAAAAALNAGEVDLADISIDAVLRLRAENDVPVRGVVATAIGSSFLIAGKEEITSIAELEGRSYAIADTGSLDHQLTQAVLRASGMAPDAPAFVAIGAPDVRVQALAAGQVDATTVSFGTWSSIAGTEGLHVIVPPDEFSAMAPAMTKFVAGLESTLAEKEDAVNRFVGALIAAARDMKADPGTWVDLAAAARPDISREALVRTSELNHARWCINGCMNPEAMAGSLDFIYANPDFAGVPVVGTGDILDLSFTERALADLGVAGGDGFDARN